MNRWTGKVAVVVGACSGVGYEICKTLCENGMIVVALSNENVKLQIFSAENHKKIHAMRFNLDNEEGIVYTLRQIVEQYGGIDILINNSAYITCKNSIDRKSQSWQEAFDNNVLMLNACAREAIISMKNRGFGGNIINVCRTNECAATKVTLGAVISSIDIIRQELKESRTNIKITNIIPKTKFYEVPKEDIGKQASHLKTCPYLIPSDVCYAIIQILSVPPHISVDEITMTGEKLS